MRDPYATVASMVRDAERHADDMAQERVRALEYYRGEMKDTPSDVGRSKVVSRDVRVTIKKVMPSIMRTIFGGDSVVEYMPVAEGDDLGAEQATDYVNHIVVPEADVRRAVQDAVHDALLIKNGVLKWWWEERQCVKFSRHSGLTDDAFAVLAGDAEVEVVEHSEREEVMPDGTPVLVHDCKIKRTTTERGVKVGAVPRERFLIHPDALSIPESRLVGEKTTLTRSDLVAMGYDRELVYKLSGATDDDYEEAVRRDFVATGDEADPANEDVDYYDLYVRVDADGDGIAELRHICFAGGLNEKNVLIDEECDEVQFCDIACQRQPHQWEGWSLADDLMDIQQVKTVLLRQTLDNIYWQNNPQPVMQQGGVTNPDAVFNPEFGKPIIVRDGTDARAAYSVQQVPFVAQQSFAMMEYLDGEARDRTGVSDASGGLPPDALQNMTATASALIEQAGIGQTEMLVRTIADGLRVFFRGVLRLIVRHQDAPRTVRLRDEWVQFDPRQWDAEMDCAVNVGLGAGTRERDMAVMTQVMSIQQQLLAGFGPDNPFVKPENVYAALSRLVESAGLKTPGLYFTEPDPQEVQAKLDAMKNQPSPEMEKVKAQAQAEQAKLQAQTQADQQKLQSENALAMQRMNAEADLKRQQMMAEIQLKREQMAAEMQLKREQMAVEASIQANMPSGSVRFGGDVG